MGQFRIKSMSVSSSEVCDLYFLAPALEFSTLLEVTNAETIYVHASCT